MVTEVGEIIGVTGSIAAALAPIAASCGAAASARADAAATTYIRTVAGHSGDCDGSTFHTMCCRSELHAWSPGCFASIGGEVGERLNASAGATTTAAAAHAPEASASGMVIGGAIAILLVIVVTWLFACASLP